MIRLASVPFVNALPLIWSLRDDPSVELTFAPPSELPAKLESGEADAVLVSSFYALTQPGRVCVDGIGIGSDGETGSVRMFTRNPLSNINALGLDPASLTSNCLAQILVTEASGRTPNLVPNCVSLNDGFWRGADAVVAIGDRGMTETCPGTEMLDLGTLWRESTGLPFVWAMWTGLPSTLTPEIADLLRAATMSGLQSLDAIALEAQKTLGRECRAYFEENIKYDFDDRYKEGLQEYAKRLPAPFATTDTLPGFL